MRRPRGRPKGVKNSPRKLPFTQTEIMRAIRATQRMGFAVKNIVINPLAGTITIEPVETAAAPASAEAA
jgi:hypothetical protein